MIDVVVVAGLESKIAHNDLTTDKDIHCKCSIICLLHKILDGIRDSSL